MTFRLPYFDPANHWRHTWSYKNRNHWESSPSWTTSESLSWIPSSRCQNWSRIVAPQCESWPRWSCSTPNWAASFLGWVCGWCHKIDPSAAWLFLAHFESANPSTLWWVDPSSATHPEPSKSPSSGWWCWDPNARPVCRSRPAPPMNEFRFGVGHISAEIVPEGERTGGCFRGVWVSTLWILVAVAYHQTWVDHWGHLVPSEAASIATQTPHIVGDIRWVPSSRSWSSLEPPQQTPQTSSCLPCEAVRGWCTTYWGGINRYYFWWWLPASIPSLGYLFQFTSLEFDSVGVVLHTGLFGASIWITVHWCSISNSPHCSSSTCYSAPSIYYRWIWNRSSAWIIYLGLHIVASLFWDLLHAVEPTGLLVENPREPLDTI